METSDSLETDLVAFDGLSLDHVRRHLDRLQEPVDRLLKQVIRPRYNLGSGPPGRAD